MASACQCAVIGCISQGVAAVRFVAAVPFCRSMQAVVGSGFAGRAAIRLRPINAPPACVCHSLPAAYQGTGLLDTGMLRGKQLSVSQPVTALLCLSAGILPDHNVAARMYIRIVALPFYPNPQLGHSWTTPRLLNGTAITCYNARKSHDSRWNASKRDHMKVTFDGRC